MLGGLSDLETLQELKKIQVRQNGKCWFEFFDLVNHIWIKKESLLIYFQLVLDEGEELDRKMADKLIAIYFSFFKASIKKGDIDSKLVRILFDRMIRIAFMHFQ